MSNTKPVLSICLTCRDGREEKYNSRGGERFAKKIETVSKDKMTLSSEER
jgi:hypothetical protein